MVMNVSPFMQCVVMIGSGQHLLRFLANKYRNILKMQLP